MSQALVLLSLRYFDNKLTTRICCSIHRQRNTQDSVAVSSSEHKDSTVTQIQSPAPPAPVNAPGMLADLSTADWRDLLMVARDFNWFISALEVGRQTEG